MDLFELLQNDSLLTPEAINDITFLQQHFAYFKSLLDSLLINNELRPLDSFARAFQTSLTSSLLVPFLGNYYIESLDKAILNQYTPFYQTLLNSGPQQINKILEFIVKTYESNVKFLEELKGIIGNEQSIYLKKLLKERFLVNFIKQEKLLEHIGAIFSLELRKFKKSITESHSQKLDPKFLKYLFCFLPPENEILSSIDPQIFKWISYITIEFETLEDLQNLLIKLFNKEITDFFRCDIENFEDYEENNLLNHAFQYSNLFLQNFIKMLATLLNTHEFSYILKTVSQKIDGLIAEDFCLICKDKLFDMILAYPDSEKVLLDLTEAIQKANNCLSDIGDALLSCIKKRLLIPGVITQNILNQYINILKVLQFLDKGLIFSKITAPIKAYLLKRPDTLRCTIAHLTEDSENYTKMVKETVKIPSKEEQLYDLTSDEDEAEAEKWEVLALLSQKKNKTIRVKYQESDLVSVLVNLYGSQEAFLHEYQIMLAEKFLGPKEYNIEEEIKNIELLKARFGENDLHSCDILVKDVKESKRIDQNIHNNFDKSMLVTFRPAQDSLSFEKLHPLFSSKGYWPINYEYENNFKVPANLKQIFNDYSQKYAEIKAMRKLVWHYQLGFVNLTLSFDNGDFEFKCLPIHAILISYFDETKCNDKIGVSSEFLAKELGVTGNEIKQKMAFWVHKKVIREIKNFTQMKSHYSYPNPSLRKVFAPATNNSFFSYLEHENDIVIYFPNKICENSLNEDENISFYEENDNNGLILKDLNGGDFESNQFNSMVEGLIMTMLTTNGPKSAEKIYNLLKTVYKTNISYPYNENQTKEILKNMMVKQKISFNGELYSAII